MKSYAANRIESYDFMKVNSQKFNSIGGPASYVVLMTMVAVGTKCDLAREADSFSVLQLLGADVTWQGRILL